MRPCRYAVAICLALIVGCGPAYACRVMAPFNSDDIQFADMVVVGRISNYRIVPDQTAREDRKKMLAETSGMPADLRQQMEEQTSFLTDYARFDVLVDEVLAGKAPPTLHVTWDNSTFGEPAELDAGQYLVALRDPRSPLPPLRGPSATMLPSREPETLTVLQAPCSSAFLFPSHNEVAIAIRAKLLGGRN